MSIRVGRGTCFCFLFVEFRGILRPRASIRRPEPVQLNAVTLSMFEPENKSAPKPDQSLLPAPPQKATADSKQRRMMVMALLLLLAALGFVLYGDRDFWFPDTQEAQEEDAAPTQSASAATAPAKPATGKVTPRAGTSKASVVKPGSTAASVPKESAAAAADAPAAAVQRTVLPPLEVEVVAGDVHRTVRPGSNSVRVDLQPGTAAPEVSEAPATNASPANTANLTKASERVEMSADASEIVSRSVRPGYPMLARQMKVQGSVILQALISRDGAIQDLHVMSGPPILAGAAREAVKQWRFKPHYQGAEAVETQARITVNFTISTN
jgi:protein TonB